MKGNTNFFLWAGAIIMALPLLAVEPFFFPPEWGKAIGLRIIFSAILAVFLWLTLYNDGFRQKTLSIIKANRFVVFFLLVILGIAFLSLLFSLDVNFSLWSSPHRSGGFINFAFCVFFALILFFSLKNSDWEKLWLVSFIVGIFVTLFAFVQYFDLMPQKIIDYARPVSTMSVPAILAAYLSLLSVFAAVFALRERKSKKAIFYWSCFFLFTSGIFITGARAAYLTFGISAVYFLIFYPKKIFKLKMLALSIILVLIAIVLLANFGPLPAFLENNPKLSFIKNRLSLENAVQDLGQTRFAAWQTFLSSIREKPILGWGAENQSIAFDKYYDPSLPYMVKSEDNWWDRAHNVFLDLAVQYGVPFLAVYLFFFGYIFWQLQNLKKRSGSILAHAAQTSLLIYFINLFFEFETVSTIIILFFITGYSMHLISPIQNEEQKDVKNYQNKSWGKTKIFGYTIFCLMMIIFLWQYAFLPLQINAKVNSAEDASCQEKLPRLEKLFSQKSFLDSFVRSKYVDEVLNCQKYILQINGIKFIEKAIDALEESSKIRPNYSRTWILLGGFEAVLAAEENDIEKKAELLKRLNNSFNKAQELSPNRPEIIIERIKGYLVVKEYQKMKQGAEECKSLDKNNSSCYWYLGLSEILLKEDIEAEKNLSIAREKGYPHNTEGALNQLIFVYTTSKNYASLIAMYKKILIENPKAANYYAKLAGTYKEAGDYKNAKITALKILDVVDEEHLEQAEQEVQDFINTLPY